MLVEADSSMRVLNLTLINFIGQVCCSMGLGRLERLEIRDLRDRRMDKKNG